MSINPPPLASAPGNGRNELCMNGVAVATVVTNSQASSASGPAAKRKRVDEYETIDQNYFRSYADITIHQEMLGDRVRTSTYRQAILRNYERIKGKVVADIGAGTGILSMFCIQAGAKKVYAIEASEMAEQAKVLISCNKMTDRISVIHARVEDCELPEKVDVIVSEWMGHMLFYESMLPSVIFARDKWLKEGGLMLPSAAELFLAPLAHVEEYVDSLKFWDEFGPEYKINMSAMKPYARKCLAQRVHVRSVSPQDIVSKQAQIGAFNLETITTSQLQRIESPFSFDSYGRVTVGGFVSWFKVIFPCGTVLSTSPFLDYTHWQQSVIFVDRPLMLEQGDVMHGSIEITPNIDNPRFIEIDLKYNLSQHNRHVSHRAHCSMNDFMF